MNFVERWVDDAADNPHVLVDRVLNYCHLTGLKVVDDGVGCPCQPHAAKRAAGAEAALERAKDHTAELRDQAEQLTKRAEAAELEWERADQRATDLTASFKQVEKERDQALEASAAMFKASQEFKQALIKAQGRISALEADAPRVKALESKLDLALKALTEANATSRSKSQTQALKQELVNLGHQVESLLSSLKSSADLESHITEAISLLRK